MRLQTSLHPDRQLRLTWSMSLPSTSIIEQKKYRKSWLPCTTELQTQPSENWISFDGNPLHWFQFWGDFEELIASNTSLTNIEKFTYLNQALLTPESQKIAAEAGGPRKNFDKSVKALKASYEDKRLIYQRSVQKFVETGRDLGLNRKDLNSLKSSLNGIETTMEQCEGDTLDKMKAAIMLLKFGRDLEAAWKRGDYQTQRAPLHQGCGRLSGRPAD